MMAIRVTNDKSEIFFYQKKRNNEHKIGHYVKRKAIEEK